MRPNFSMVRLKQNLTSHWCDQPFERGKKSLCDSESLHVVQQQTHIRLISWSKPIRDSEGRSPPSDWPWSRYSCTCVYVWKCVCCCSQTEREVSSRDALCCQLNNFLDPPSDFFPKKRLVTNLATSWTNFSESLWSGIAAAARDQRARSSFPARALFSERSVKTDIIASLILHANIAEITAQDLSVLSCVYYLISSDNGSIKL